MFEDTTPKYIYEFVNHLESQETELFDCNEDIDTEGNTMRLKFHIE